MSRRILAAAAIAAAALIPAPLAAQPVCPENEYTLSDAETLRTTAPVLDASSSSGGSYRVAYDLVAGTLALEYCCSLHPTYVTVQDAYDVAGVPSGTPVPLTVELPVSGEVYDAGLCGGSGCGGHFLALLQHGAEFQEFWHSPHLFAGARSPFSTVLRLPLTIVAGQPEVVRFQFWARRGVGGSHGAWGNGTIGFTGLPPGATVISCQGFAGQVTPARRASWGAVKTIYR